MTLQTPLSKARGLGSAKGGVHHWWVQRVSGAALVPLTLWFIFSVANLAGAPHADWAQWLANPLNTVLMIALVLCGFHHGHLGLQVVIEDYIRKEAVKLILITSIRWFAALLAISSIFAILKATL